MAFVGNATMKIGREHILNTLAWRALDQTKKEINNAGCSLSGFCMEDNIDMQLQHSGN